MYRLRYLCGALIVVLSLNAGISRADDKPATEQLADAMKQYDAGDYAGAESLINAIDASKLTDEVDQLNYQKYKANIRTALDAIAAADRDYASGEAALREGRYSDARTSFNEVVSNRFAAEDLKGRARTKISEADALESEARSAEAEAHTEQPAPTQGDGDLVDKLAEEHSLLWQQAVTTYRNLEEKIRKAVVENRYSEAKSLMERAKDTIRSNRRYAAPPSVYDDYWNQAQELEHFVLDQERLWNEKQVIDKHKEIEDREAQRIREAEEAKQRQVDQLMAQAAELRKEQRYEEAITVLKEVLAIDPTNDAAAVQKETLEDVAVHTRNFDAAKTRHSESQDLMVETEESLIPWHKDLLYPKNWPEISAKRVSAEEVTDSPENRATRRKLEETSPEIKFDGIAFEQVIDYLRDVTGLNIVVNWSALEFADIEREAEITLRLQNVKFSKALDEILRTVGGGETELAYEIDAGVITISTKEDLSRRTKIQVYNVEDLLHTVPNFVGRSINLDQIGQNTGGGGGGGGGAGGFGGLGGGGGGGGGGIFGGGGGEGGEEEGGGEEDPLQRLIELIQATIDPESWREAGGNVGTIQTLNNQIIITQTSTAVGSPGTELEFAL